MMSRVNLFFVVAEKTMCGQVSGADLNVCDSKPGPTAAVDVQ